VGEAVSTWAKTWAENAADWIDNRADFAGGFVAGVAAMAVVNVGFFWLDYYLQRRPF
jgi:hypothetical protein